MKALPHVSGHWDRGRGLCCISIIRSCYRFAAAVPRCRVVSRYVLRCRSLFAGIIISKCVCVCCVYYVVCACMLRLCKHVSRACDECVCIGLVCVCVCVYVCVCVRVCVYVP